MLSQELSRRGGSTYVSPTWVDDCPLLNVRISALKGEVINCAREWESCAHCTVPEKLSVDFKRNRIRFMMLIDLQNCSRQQVSLNNRENLFFLAGGSLRYANVIEFIGHPVDCNIAMRMVLFKISASAKDYNSARGIEQVTFLINDQVRPDVLPCKTHTQPISGQLCDSSVFT